LERLSIDPDEPGSRKSAIGTVTRGCAGRRTGFLDGRVEVAARAPIARAVPDEFLGRGGGLDRPLASFPQEIDDQHLDRAATGIAASRG
jgi:hypothetical protein